MWWLLAAVVLLLLAPRHAFTDRPKAVVVLDPPWDRILKRDSVRLTCRGPPGSQDSSAQWWHNGRALAQQAASWEIPNATMEISGNYSCQTGLSAPSDPQSLEVHGGWLVLQARSWKVQVGDPIRLRCHSWDNRRMNKVIYFHNDKGRFFRTYEDLFIPKATPAHSGSYFCRGFIGKHNESSAVAQLLVEDPSSPLPSPSRTFPSRPSPPLPSPSPPSPAPSQTRAPWHRIALSLAEGLLFAVNTGLCLSVWFDLRSLLRARRSETIGWKKDLQDK